MKAFPPRKILKTFKIKNDDETKARRRFFQKSFAEEALHTRPEAKQPRQGGHTAGHKATQDLDLR